MSYLRDMILQVLGTELIDCIMYVIPNIKMGMHVNFHLPSQDTLSRTFQCSLSSFRTSEDGGLYSGMLHVFTPFQTPESLRRVSDHVRFDGRISK